MTQSASRQFCRIAQAVAREYSIEGCCFDYLCTDSTGEAIAWLKQHGVLKGGFAVQ